jgi:hypothetical protein
VCGAWVSRNLCLLDGDNVCDYNEGKLMRLAKMGKSDRGPECGLWSWLDGLSGFAFVAKQSINTGN